MFQKSIMFLSERGKERERYSNWAPIKHLQLLCFLNIFIVASATSNIAKFYIFPGFMET